MAMRRDAAERMEGQEAILASGFPLEFIKALQAISEHGGPVISFRCGQPPNLNKGFPVSPKPMSIKTKTCTDAQGIAFLSGYIADNQQLFGRKGAHWGENGSEAEVIREKLKNNPSESIKVSSVPLQVPLREIITGIYEGKYERIREDDDYLYFRSPLSAEQIAAYADPTLDRDGMEFRIKKNRGDPGDLKVSAGEVLPEVVLGEIDFRLSEEEAFKPLEVISYDGAPVTGDADFLGVAAPLYSQFQEASVAVTGDSLDAEMFAAYNTASTEELTLLFFQYIKLKNIIEGREMSAEDIDKDTDFQTLLKQHPSVQTAGIITPFELYVMLTVNAEMAELPEHLRRGRENLIRHGAENHNPGDPSALTGNMLHILNGQVIITENETQLRDFYLYDAEPDKYYFHVHPRWNMEIWAPLVARQIELGQRDLMHPDTVNNFEAYAARAGIPIPVPAVETDSMNPVELRLSDRKSVICSGDVSTVSTTRAGAEFARTYLGISAEEIAQPFLTITIPSAANSVSGGEHQVCRHRFETCEVGAMSSRSDFLRMTVLQDNIVENEQVVHRAMVHMNPDELSRQGESGYFLMAATLMADSIAMLGDKEKLDRVIQIALTDPRLPPAIPAMMHSLAERAGLQLEIDYGSYGGLKNAVGKVVISGELFDRLAESPHAALFMSEEKAELRQPLSGAGH